MAGRRGGAGLVVLVLVVFAAGAAAALAMTGKLPTMKQALAPIASAVAPVASAIGAATWIPGPAMSAPPDAGSPPDAGTKYTRQASPLSSAQLGAPLVHGAFVGTCGAPDNMKVTVDLSVRRGRAEKVNVTTVPPDATVTACIEHAVRDLRWDVSPHAGRLTVTY